VALGDDHGGTGYWGGLACRGMAYSEVMDRYELRLSVRCQIYAGGGNLFLSSASFAADV